MAHEEKLAWSKAIAKGQPNVSLELPPTAIYQLWLNRNNSVTQTSRRTEAHPERLEARAEIRKRGLLQADAEHNKEEMKMAMAERMADKIDRMNRRREEQ